MNKFFRKLLLWPFATVYALVVSIRHRMYDSGTLKSRSFDVPTLCVGNLRVGGTGKTPMTDYLVGKLKKQYKVAVLSRGYKRRTKGFVLASANSTTRQIGDEPKLIKNLHPDVMVAVCEDRAHGIEKIMAADPSVSLIILDDAFQHRAVRPTVSILLSECGKLYMHDSVMPVGHLRDLKSRAAKADIIAVTKCPPDAKPIDLRLIYREMNMKVYQRLVFMTLRSDPPVSLTDRSEAVKGAKIAVTTAIASSGNFVGGLEKNYDVVRKFIYKDHYNYTKNDILHMFRQMGKDEILVCTAKDAVKIEELGLTEDILARIYVVHIKFEVLPYQQALNDIEFISVIKQKLNGTYRSNSPIYKP